MCGAFGKRLTVKGLFGVWSDARPPDHSASNVNQSGVVGPVSGFSPWIPPRFWLSLQAFTLEPLETLGFGLNSGQNGFSTVEIERGGC